MTSNSNGKNQNVKNQVIILLLSGMSVDAISRQLDVSDKTIQTWLKQSDFMEGRVRISVMDANLDKGVYFLQIKSGDATKTQKLAIR